MGLWSGFFGRDAGRTIGVLLTVAAMCCVAASSAAASEVINTINVGVYPSGVSSDGTHVWVTNYAEDTVSEIEASTGKVINTINVGEGPDGVSSDGTHVWVTNYDADTVSEIEASTGEVINTINVGESPYGVSSDGTHVWVTNVSEGTVSEIEASTGEVINTINVGVTPGSVSSDGTHVWVTNVVEGRVIEIAASTGKVINMINVGSEPEGVSSDGTHVWVTNYDGDTVSEIEASTGEVINTIEVGEVPDGVSSDGTHVWVTNNDRGTVSEIEASTGEVINTINVGDGSVGVSSDGTHVWVTNDEEDRVSEILIAVSAPTLVTGAESEVAPTSVTLNATVNPNGAEVSECVFEYGTTVAYGSSVPCAPALGAGERPVAVSGALASLSPHTSYHYRVSAKNILGTSHGSDRTFTTTASSVSASTMEPAVPAKAEDGALSGTAGEGVGTVTVGVYESDPAGPPPYRSTGVFSDVALAAGSTFEKLEFKDCELKGARNVWWVNGAGSWQPVSSSAVVYTPSPGPCITVTITESTSPDLAQMGGTRFGYGEVGAPEYGKCLAAKDANFTEGACGTVAEKKGKPDHKGKYEWFAAPVGCYAQKDGNYTESACETVAGKTKKGVFTPDHKGKYEEGAVAVTGTIGPAKLALGVAATIECTAGSSEGELMGAKTATGRVTLTGCKQGSVKCSSTGEPAETIRTDALESFVYEAAKKVYDELTGSPIMKFSCGSGEVTLNGTVSGEATVDTNSMSAKGETTYRPGLGEQVLSSVEASGRVLETSLTLTETTTSTQPQEINTKT
jgi:YVTN family beta-propeller protein